MTIRIRSYQPADYRLILSLVPRFSEFELPAWRLAEGIDRKNRVSIEQAMGQLGADSAIFVTEEESSGTLAGFVHCQTQTDYFDGKKQGYISDLAVQKSFEGRESDGACCGPRRTGLEGEAILFSASM